MLLQVVSALPNRADVLLLMGAICYQLKDYAQVRAAAETGQHSSCMGMLYAVTAVEHEQQQVQDTFPSQYGLHLCVGPSDCLCQLVTVAVIRSR